MNVGKLKEFLEEFTDDTIVRFSYDNGDYWHHYVAHEVNFIDLQPVKKNGYVEDFVINDNDEGEFIEDENYAVVLS
jgi:hypothetical protein